MWPVVQLVEQRTLAPEVAGSSPARPANYSKMVYKVFCEGIPWNMGETTFELKRSCLREHE